MPRDMFDQQHNLFLLQCSCPIGYTASFCEISVSNNPCNDNPCSNGGTCTLQSLSNYTCTCPLGWKGETIHIKLDYIPYLPNSAFLIQMILL